MDKMNFIYTFANTMLTGNKKIKIRFTFEDKLSLILWQIKRCFQELFCPATLVSVSKEAVAQTKLLVHLSWSVFVCKVHLQVPVDEFALTKTNHLHAETQTRGS